ncbi:uncharacterized protein M421DRAFT_361862 [Didymella exigua CBS 183.55]|uniref:TRAF-type zinc finger protein n=1 Tax=Didymella exigua CBS 183.55 TaxID=1150837 RepID=A0A6A5RSX4_9PLEO|nr:uncharacterized protein M421DRAFT_361862 [Didymella exigua CBS 183.55]KAF1930902.1 hypothetical protein M421DRAFT_361862 [Didymella exigua CBS 183.55]
MSSPSPIPPPNDRRSSRASSGAGLANGTDALSEPSELRVRRKSKCLKVPPELSALEYTTDPDSNLVCLICHAPFDKPVQLPCEHYFCRECLQHAWAPQSAPCKTCPTCRRVVESENDTRAVPKIIETMLDELVVKCPNTKTGCTWVDHRVNVHDHVMLYCEYTPIECSAADCRLHTTQKDFHKGCLHYSVSCEDCHASLMKKDLEEHQRNLCPNRTTSCALCDAVLLRLDLKTHINNVCPKHVISCQGAIVGCKFRSERADVTRHEMACAMATMAPHFREQQARLERHEARMEPLVRKVGILEDGLGNITNMLYPANANDASFPVADHLDPNDAAAEFRLPPASFQHGAQSNDNRSSEPPFDSQVHHLLTLHENLREEVSRMSTSLTEVEGRANMMIINESQRNKDEMLHTNAAINNMRMQLHWLMSATIQQRTTTTSSSPSSTTSRPSAGTSAGTTDRSTTQGPSSRPGPSGVLPAPYRRLSDTNRQDTKL